MYELEGFGARLQQLRKQKGMTQEDLAHRVGVTGQAVSKWETDQSYPDITLITTLATILEADIHFLFGKKESTPASTHDFPKVLHGLPLVHTAQGVACYSDKAVLSIDATGVKFADGSTAELSNKLAINQGKGDIKFIGDDREFINAWPHVNHSITSMNREFGTTENIYITLSNCYCECRIVPSQDDKTRVSATGDPVFIHILEAEVSGNTLEIGQKQIENYRGHSGNEIRIEMPCEVGGKADITINGSANITSEIAKFNSGALCINGSGIIKMQGFGGCTSNINGSGEIVGTHADELKLIINGSGIIDWGTSNNAKVTINGSGDIKLESAAAMGVVINGSGHMVVNEMTGGDFSTKISGSGNIHINSGSCDKLDADISGSGDIDASGLTMREASIVLHNDGNVALGWVQERTSEQIKKKGTIRVLRRGHDN